MWDWKIDGIKSEPDLRLFSRITISANYLTMAVKPGVQRIDRNNEEGIIQAIIQDGCVIIKNFTDLETVQAANAEVRPYLEADKPWKVSTHAF